MFNHEFRKRLAQALVPRPCPKCSAPGPHDPRWLLQAPVRATFPQGDFRRAYAIGIAARLSFAADVAARDLGLELPWKQPVTMHLVNVPNEPGTMRLMAFVGAKRYVENVRLEWPCLVFEKLCEKMALDLVPADERQQELRAALVRQLDLRWPDADFHVCGISTTPAVQRVVEEFEGG